ncbi:MAG: hypothetical protein M1820_007093 [Bogoriella megaspora]|nr:MAG: hypothetical protein M1820_007093 [Bogoriella megaspora]
MQSPSVLVVGGCGFMGYHIVDRLVQDPTISTVAILSRSASQSRNRLDGATYFSGDLNNHEFIRDVIGEIKPIIIMHAASPSPVTGSPHEYQAVTVDGTKNLLKVATESPFVQVFIYTSSSTIAKGYEHLNLDENYPIANVDPKAPAYAKSKALAEAMVLEADNPLSNKKKAEGWAGYLCTGALRFPIVYGTHDLTSIPGCLNALKNGQTNVQLGDGKNLWDFCSTENAAVAHLLLAQNLMNGQDDKAVGKIHGEAFHIHDDEPRPFWEFARKVWKYAGHEVDERNIRSIPVWLASSVAIFLELLFWVFTFGKKRPQTLGKQQVEYACFTHTYSLAKAKERLRYVPKQDFDGHLEQAVKWSLEHDGWAKRLKISTS